MISSSALVKIFVDSGLTYFTGVPCSFLSSFLHSIDKFEGPIFHLPAPSEGEAMAFAAGYYLSTGKMPVVYLQNSGFGNVLDPLTSLHHEKVFNMPALLLMTWRGEPGKGDEVHHEAMGEAMLPILDTLGIDYFFLEENEQDAASLVKKIMEFSYQKGSPVALIARKNSFEQSDASCSVVSPVGKQRVTRSEAIEILLEKIKDHVVVANLGNTSRELFSIREGSDRSHEKDLLLVGSMGCVAGVALGIAMQTKKQVLALDGDGSLLMHLGSIVTIAATAPSNFYHVVFDNACYESTGGQSTRVNPKWEEIFMSVGYGSVVHIKTKEDLMELYVDHLTKPLAIIIDVDNSIADKPPRPSISPRQNAKIFVNYIR